MPVDPLTLYLNESTGLTGPALDRCTKYEIKKRMDHCYFGGPIRSFQDTVYLGKKITGYRRFPRENYWDMRHLGDKLLGYGMFRSGKTGSPIGKSLTLPIGINGIFRPKIDGALLLKK